MTFQATVLYDFAGELAGELSVSVGDVITVTNSDAGQGWLSGIRADGEDGFVPTHYVERIQDQVFSASAPVMENNLDSVNKEKTYVHSDIVNETNKAKPNPPIEVMNKAHDSVSRVEARSSSPDPGQSFSSVLKLITNAFGKSDEVCAYLMGITQSAQKEEVLIIEDSEGNFQWATQSEAFTCIVGRATKSSKFGGIKPFMTYGLTPSFTDNLVLRRYKHFVWLHERLVDKFGTVIAIPPLPWKLAIGIAGEDVLEKRRIRLQSFTDRICRHPVLSNSSVWKHFVEEADEKKWTEGKRKSEEDTNIRCAFLTNIQAVRINEEAKNRIDEKINTFSNTINDLKRAVNNMTIITKDQITKYVKIHNKGYRNIGKAFYQLGFSISGELSEFIQIGASYQEMSSLWDNQVTKDWEPLHHVMQDYKGLAEEWQVILRLYENMREKQSEIMALDDNEIEKEASIDRLNMYRIAVESERSFFGKEVVLDMAQSGQTFLKEQISFHGKLAQKLKELHKKCGVDSIVDHPIDMMEHPGTVNPESIFINESSIGRIQWVQHHEPYTCKVEAPLRSSKFGGMKPFTNYQVTPSFTNYQVARRYKHFDWLHQRLQAKYGKLIPIPPLPEKQLTGIFEEDLIKERMVLLQQFTNRMCRHPVLSNAEVWRHFLIQVDDKQWTEGKRKAEADKNVGFVLLNYINVPSSANKKMINHDEMISKFGMDMSKYLNAVKNMKSLADDQINKHKNKHINDFRDIGEAFSQLGAAMNDEAHCFNKIGRCYQEMCYLWEKKCSNDWENVQHTMQMYKGLAEGWQALLEEYEKGKEDLVVERNKLQIVIEAEATFFKNELSVDMSNTAQVFLTGQIDFHKQVADKLEKIYQDCWPGHA